ncbi:hypothetical protein [Pseudoclavibacter sp. 13-3]|uniref:hypothetical protein n=1 Tax=Pseudoclavibacter sp. 13-3 TaxID=2901228 RepID=UPI001E293270|nr:hypothetical protein [Pseudoclavibacter sp. 13-3]MCD7100747.1 hypothetical protein [Pseudoclavibacter sp. 13-3]
MPLPRVGAFTAALLLAAGALAACSAGGQDTSSEQNAVSEERTSPSSSGEESRTAAPASCADLRLDAEGVIAGAQLGPCLADGLAQAGTLRSTQYSAGEQTGHSDVVIVPELAISGTSSVGGTESRVVSVGGETWADLGDGWVHGDESSSNPVEVIVAQAGQVALATMNPQAIADGIASCPSWRVDAQRAELRSEGGVEAGAVPVRCEGTLTLGGVQVQDAAVFFRPDWTPLGTEGTGVFAGVSSAFAAHYYDHGAQISVQPPVGQ